MVRTTEPASRRGYRQRDAREPSRREELIEAALALFNEKGYEATSVQDVADAMNILKGSLYHYMQSKDDLLFWVIERTHARFLDTVTAVQTMDATPREKLVALIEGHVRIATRHVLEAKVYAEEFKSLDPNRRKVIVNQRRRYETFARQLIEAAQQAGTAATDVSPRLAGLAIMSMLTAIPRWYRPGGSISADELAASYGRYALRIIGGD